MICHDVKAIVIACNTATSACVKLLREKYDVDIIGMEPALKVACDRGEHQRIAVWATQLTLSEKKFANLMNRFKGEHHIIKVPCPELVRMVEDNKLDDAYLVESCLKEYLAASDYKNLDSIVLGVRIFLFTRNIWKSFVQMFILLKEAWVRLYIQKICWNKKVC